MSLSAGDAGSLLSDVGNADFGTSFAVSTSLYGRNHIDVSGGLGQSISGGMPTMGVRATYSRNDSDGEYAMPELTVMMRQVALPNRPGTSPLHPTGLLRSGPAPLAITMLSMRSDSFTLSTALRSIRFHSRTGYPV